MKISGLTQATREYGPGRAVLLDRHATIIAGNKTVEQAKRLNILLRVVSAIFVAPDLFVALGCPNTGDCSGPATSAQRLSCCPVERNYNCDFQISDVWRG